MKDELPIPVFEKQAKWQWVWQDIENYVTEEGIAFLKSLGVTEMKSQVFKGLPKQKTTIHTDSKVNDDNSLYTRTCWGINFAWNAEDSEMMWYKPLTTKITTSHGSGENDINYNIFDEGDVEVIEKTILTGLTLVRIDIPHAVINRDDKNNRYCFSLRDYTVENNGDHQWSWEQTVEQFKPWIVE